MHAFYEPNYESGKAVRWRIERADGQPFCLAGIWERRMHDEGPAHWSFSMLTINADEHPLMRVPVLFVFILAFSRKACRGHDLRSDY